MANPSDAAAVYRAFSGQLLPAAGPAVTLNPRQKEAADTPAFETLYGGQAGPGKTFLIVWLAKARHHRALLMRRTYPQLEDSIELEAFNLYGERRFYNGSKHVWFWPGTGQRIRLGHCEYEDDVLDHQSAQYDLVALDELTQFTRLQYVYMISRVRTTRAGQRCRIMGCTNPGGEGMPWVKERWAAWLDPRHPHPAASGEVRHYRPLPDGSEMETTPDDPEGVSRTFIRATLADNPHLGEDYRKRLSLLPEPYRSQLMHGDWSAGDTDDAWQLVPSAWIDAAVNRWTPDCPTPPTALGADVARGGDDSTCLVEARGWWFDHPAEYPGVVTTNGPQVAALLMMRAQAGQVIALDVASVGAAVEDALAANSVPFLAYNGAFASKASDVSGRLRFVNLRAEAHWRVREAFERGVIAIPPDLKLIQELKALRWELTVRGVKIVDKDEVRKRLGRSPDRSDALVMAAWANERSVVPNVGTASPRESRQMLKGYYS